MRGYLKHVEDAKTMCFLVEDEKLLTKQKNIQQDLKNDDKKKNRLTPIVY